MSKVYATVNQFVGHGGQSVWIGAGDVYESSDPLVKAHPDMFTKEPSAAAVMAEERATRVRRSTT